MTPQEFERALTQGVVAPVCFLCGDNLLLIERALHHIQTTLVPHDSALFNLHQFTAPIHGPADILHALRTPPFPPGQKVVIVRDAHLFKAAQWESLYAACKKKAPQCCLVFVFSPAPTQKEEKKRIKTFHAYGTVVEYENPKGEKSVGACAARELSRYGKKISPDALALLSALLDEDAQKIAREVEKLALFCGTRDLVTREDVADIVSSGTRTVFALIDAMVQGNSTTALTLLNNVLEAGTHPLAILKLLAHQFRQMSTVQALLGRGASTSDIRRALGWLPMAAVETLSREARIWFAGSRGRIFELLFEADALVKLSKCESRILLEQLIVQLSVLRTQCCAAATAV